MRVEFRPFGEGGRMTDSKKDALALGPRCLAGEAQPPRPGRPGRRDQGGPAAVTGEARLARPEGPGDRIRGKKLIQRENHETVAKIASRKSRMLQDRQEVLKKWCGRAAAGNPTAPGMKKRRDEILRPSGRTA